MTIKQLKSYMRDNDIDVPRGEASQLKLKKQIVDFIWGHCNGNDDGHDDDDNDNDNDNDNDIVRDDVHNKNQMDDAIDDGELQNGADVTADKRKPRKRSLGTGMPPLSSSSSSLVVKNDRGKQPSKSYNLTPKDRIVLDVLEMYPPLYDAMIAAYREDNDIDDDHPPLLDEDIDLEQFCDITSMNYKVPNDIGEGDIRQRFHPILRKAAPTDMDIVFIGTASCTPGVTRGVSCTAVRLNWRSSRPYLGDGQDKKKTAKENGFVEERGPTGGTWLFDCGEATQVIYFDSVYFSIVFFVSVC